MASVATADTAEYAPVPRNSLPDRMHMVWDSLPTAAQSRLQMAWDLETKNTGQVHKIYKKTVALLLSWKNSDLITSDEVSALPDMLTAHD